MVAYFRNNNNISHHSALLPEIIIFFFERYCYYYCEISIDERKINETTIGLIPDTTLHSFLS